MLSRHVGSVGSRPPSQPNTVKAGQGPSPQDNTPKASGHGGKIENDHDQKGEQEPTQKNESQRTSKADMSARRTWVTASSCNRAVAQRAVRGANRRDAFP